MSTIDSPLAVIRPKRTCVGCRRTAAKSELLRVVCIDGELIADPAARLAGRGAYVHRNPGCLETAMARRAFQRALRLDSPPDGRELRMFLTTTHHAGA